MKSVCVIGAGAAGLTAAKNSIQEGLNVTVFEQSDQLGGTWVYSDSTECHSSTYQGLITNLPKQTMMFENLPYPDDEPSFLKQQKVLDYLVKYAEDLPIKLNHKVTRVTRENEKWRVEVEHDSSISSALYDILFVCNGHYFEPRIPLDYSRFKGRVLHSHNYKRASDFYGQKVLVVGAGSSGVDIAVQLASQNTKVYLTSRVADYSGLPDCIIQHSAHVSEITEDGVKTTDGEEFEEIDTIIFCTGYNMKIPFLSSDIIQLKADNQMVSPLFQHAVHVKYPKSLFFIGLNLVAITFPLFECQVRMALAFALEKTPLPSHDELEKYEDTWMERQRQRGLGLDRFHKLSSQQWPYFHEINSYAIRPYKLEYIKLLSELYTYCWNDKKKSSLDFKGVNFNVDYENYTFTVEQKNRQ